MMQKTFIALNSAHQTQNDLIELKKCLKTAFESLPELNVGTRQLITNRVLSNSISKANFQFYTAPLFFSNLNGAASINLENGFLSVGLGKARFFPFKDINFGFITGVDFGLKFHPLAESKYGGLVLKGFIGIGRSF